MDFGMPPSPTEFYDEAALLDRLTTGIMRTEQSVVFLVGSALTAPVGGAPGVPNVQGVIDLIKDEFPAGQRGDLEDELRISPQPYQSAFSYLTGRRGQGVANEVIKRAVAMSRSVSTSITSLNDAECDNLDQGNENWSLSPAVKALGQLVVLNPVKFGRTVLTTNFDPLIQVAIRSAGGVTYRTVLHRDGHLNQTHSSGCHVVHLHGYWHGTDTLHTTRQLNQARPRLKASLKTLIGSNLLVVVGYGGWDDIFTEALREIIEDDTAKPEIIWTFLSRNPTQDNPLIERLAPGLDRGRVSFYAGIDCHEFFPALMEKWRQSIQGTLDNSNPTRGEALPPDRDEDRPPRAEIFVGREKELNQLFNMSQRACFITGFGGQGKSTIAARYFEMAKEHGWFNSFVWRDCKEEGERFESQVIDIIVRLSGGHSSAAYLSQQSMEVLAELLAGLTRNRRVLFVFDNVDHYVDLEKNNLVGNAAKFLAAYLSFGTSSQVIFTCRPDIQYPDANVLTLGVSGLGLDETAQLFEKRGAARSSTEVLEVHQLTSGHAFWLDLIAAQVSKKQAAFRDILNGLVGKSGAVPASVFSSLTLIWGTLEDNQKLVLQTMGEAVRPETAQTLGDYLGSQMRYNRVTRVLRALRDLNLIVIKPSPQSDDLFDLHPLVREFIRQTFPLEDRVRFIDCIIAVYGKFIALFSPDLATRPARDLRYWTENAELLIEAEKYEDAFEKLSDVAQAFYSSDLPGEFSRVASILFRKIDWNNHQTYRNFDRVFGRHFRILVNLGREHDYEELLKRYQETMPAKDARYINYCALRSHMHWTRSEFQEAVKWAEAGKELKERTNVDTRFTASHELALAQRDAGHPEKALDHFLDKVALNDVLDPDEFDEEKGESFYGNTGRCLHLMGKIDEALICYRKSALILHRSPRGHFENRGFIRTWIGELLVAKGEFCDAKLFLEAAERIWNLVTPPRAKAVRQKLDEIETLTRDCPSMSVEDAERYVLAWINDRARYFVGLY
jgi:tetratricopeptide (TPR) repeat protein